MTDIPSPRTRHVLIVEDDNGKYSDVIALLTKRYNQSLTDCQIVRADTVVMAEHLLVRDWHDLVILDISMNIDRGSLGPMRGGHANLGGLDIIEKMYFLELERPTILLTGFDYFRRVGASTAEMEMVSLTELEARARRYLGDRLIGCVRYGRPHWEVELTKLLKQGGL